MGIVRSQERGGGRYKKEKKITGGNVNPPGKRRKINFFKGEKVCFSFDDVIVPHNLSLNCHSEMNFSEIIY